MPRPAPVQSASLFSPLHTGMLPAARPPHYSAGRSDMYTWDSFCCCCRPGQCCVQLAPRQPDTRGCVGGPVPVPFFSRGPRPLPAWRRPLCCLGTPTAPANVFPRRGPPLASPFVVCPTCPPDALMHTRPSGRRCILGHVCGRSSSAGCPRTTACRWPPACLSSVHADPPPLSAAQPHTLLLYAHVHGARGRLRPETRAVMLHARPPLLPFSPWSGPCNVACCRGTCSPHGNGR